MDYMVKQFQDKNGNEPVIFKSKELNENTQYDLKTEDVMMRYHGDGIKKYPRPIVVLEGEEASKVYKPKIHHTVLKLMKSERFYLAEDFNSFIKPQKITYSPVNVNCLADRYITTS
jgi:hypothetical protein